MEETKKTKRGFAALSPEKRREIASAGGKAAHACGTAHRFDSQTGKRAGVIGGQRSGEIRRAAMRAVEEQADA